MNRKLTIYLVCLISSAFGQFTNNTFYTSSNSSSKPKVEALGIDECGNRIAFVSYDKTEANLFLANGDTISADDGLVFTDKSGNLIWQLAGFNQLFWFCNYTSNRNR